MATLLKIQNHNAPKIYARTYNRCVIQLISPLHLKFHYSFVIVGNDGGKIHFVKLQTSRRHHGVIFQCFITKKLDYEDFETVECTKIQNSTLCPKCCNSHEKFCALKFNETTFAGAHNAGTGMSSVLALDCYVKNHDLNIKEMLDLGLRFFDFDVKYYSDEDEIWTGHGPDAMYFTFANFEDVLQMFQSWMIEHSNEVIVIYVGSFKGDKAKGFQKLNQLVSLAINMM